MKPSTLALTHLAAALCTLGCAPHPEGVLANTVARLTLLGVGAVTAAVSADDRCGFASPSVVSRVRVKPLSNGYGSATLTVTDCELTLSDREELSEDCQGNTLWGAGQVTVTATRTITGYLTGDPTLPVIPSGPDAVTIKIVSARFNDFEAGTSRVDASLGMRSGLVSAVVRPRLAASASTGLCAVPTAVARIEDVRYRDAELQLIVAGQHLDLEVDTSEFHALIGRDGDVANEFGGTLSLWGRSHDLPAAGDDGRVDPEYSESAFVRSYACTEDLKLPITHVCRDPVDMLGHAVARLSVANFGTVVALVEADETCGFSSPGIALNPAVTGEVGRSGAVGVYTITTPCEINIPATVDGP